MGAGSFTIWPQPGAANPLFYASPCHFAAFMPASKTPAAPKTTQTKLAKLGLRSDMDLILHLPLRYEDETRIVPMR